MSLVYKHHGQTEGSTDRRTDDQTSRGAQASTQKKMLLLFISKQQKARRDYALVLVLLRVYTRVQQNQTEHELFGKIVFVTISMFEVKKYLKFPPGYKKVKFGFLLFSGCGGQILALKKKRKKDQNSISKTLVNEPEPSN